MAQDATHWAAPALAGSFRPDVPLRDQPDSLAFIVSAMANVEVGVDRGEHRKWLRESFATAIRVDDEEAAGAAAVALGMYARLAARYREAQRWLAEAAVHFERQDVFGILLLTYAAEVGVAAAIGDAAGAAQALRRCHATVSNDGPHPNQVPWLHRAEAWALAAGGDSDRAADHLMKAAGESAATPLYSASLAYEAMLLGAKAELAAGSLLQLRERCDAPLAEAYADHATALAAGDGAALTRARTTLRPSAPSTTPSRAPRTRRGRFCPRDVRTRLAGQHTGAGRSVPEGEGGIAPIIDGLDRIGVELTRREQQLVSLAARGLSNTEIAERLVLSVRTVESHLYRAMRKLGVSDRRDPPR